MPLATVIGQPEGHTQMAVEVEVRGFGSHFDHVLLLFRRKKGVIQKSSYVPMNGIRNRFQFRARNRAFT
jgi:hypothetical protein